MFPLDKIILNIERVNMTHEPFAKSYQQIRDNFGKIPTLQHKEETQFWLHLFFIDKLGISFSKILDGYASLYDLLLKQKAEAELQFLKFHLATCILFLLDSWLTRVEKQSHDINLLGSYLKKDEKTAVTDLFNSRNEIENVFKVVEVSFHRRIFMS